MSRLTSSTAQETLPKINGIVSLPARVWLELRNRLRAYGFDKGYPPGFLQAEIGIHAESLQRPVVQWRVRQRCDEAAYIFRILFLGDPITWPEARRALGDHLVAAFSEAGFLVPVSNERVVSAFVLRLFRGFFVLGDDLAHKGDAVYTAGYGTQAFCDFAPDRKILRALDVGCGAGAVSLWLSSRAEEVVATDTNPRALDFVRINSRLNDVGNVSVRLGSLFEPVIGETFDFVASQPPYVPRAPTLKPALYLYAGDRGDELVREILRQVPRYLNPGGRSMIVFDYAILEECDEAVTMSTEAHCDDVQRIFLLGTEVGADAYAMRLAAPELRVGIDAFDHAVVSMREHLDRIRIRGVCPSVCIVSKVSENGWSVVLPAGDSLWSEISGQMVARLMEAHAALHRARATGTRAGVAIPETCLIIRTMAGLPGQDLHLGLPPGYPAASIRLSEAEWTALRTDCEPLSENLLERLARAGLLEDIHAE